MKSFFLFLLMWWITLNDFLNAKLHLCIHLVDLPVFHVRFSYLGHERHWLVLFLLTVSLSEFGIKIKLPSANKFRCVPSFPLLWKSLCKIDIISSLNIWRKLLVNHLGLEFSFWDDYYSICLIKNLFRYSFLGHIWQLFLRDWSIASKFSNLLA